MHVVFLGAAADQINDTNARDATKADFVSTSLSDALDQITAPELPTDAVIVEKVASGEVLPFLDPVSHNRPEVGVGK